MQRPSLDAIRVFQCVAQTQSFTRAAAMLSLDKSHVSRTVRALEDTLGVALLVRSTRVVRATAEGESLLARIAGPLSAIDEALAIAPRQGAALGGDVALTATPEIARALLAPALVRFRLRFPAIHARVVPAYKIVDLLSEGIDLALRIGRPGSDAVVARRVADLSAGFFAAPAYLSRRGTPQRREELAAHDGLWPVPPRGQRSFVSGDAVPKPAIECSDFSVLAECARQGGGVALLPLALAAADVASGALVRVVPEFSLGGAALYLVSREPRSLAPRVRALRGFLLEQRWDER